MKKNYNMENIRKQREYLKMEKRQTRSSLKYKEDTHTPEHNSSIGMCGTNQQVRVLVIIHVNPTR